MGKFSPIATLSESLRVFAGVGYVSRVELLERSDQLALLDERLAALRESGRGRLVLLGGEAGAGKTALVRALYERHPGMPVLEGACESLFTPRPLGPLDTRSPPRPVGAIRNGAPHVVARSLSGAEIGG